MNIKEAKQIDMVDYLAGLGYQATDIKGNNFWYRSPLSNTQERTPSFKINRKLNRWYEWTAGENRGGNLVDFGVHYFNCSVKHFLDKLGQESIVPTIVRAENVQEKNNAIAITNVQNITSYALTTYLASRQIPLEIARRYCQEVHYNVDDKSYYALGFKNDLGGYELRNKHAKLSSSPKGVTYINNGSENLSTFEGFFNFLSYATLQQKNLVPATNYLVLNSAAFFEKNLPLMASHKRVHLYLDNDRTGQKFMEMALSADREKFIDGRKLYHGAKDLNKWLIDKSHEHHHRLKITL